ncbi:MAG: tRNA (adenosine(37)-N6)-dimethylallyltransferase MiaA [Deltaproteobacteria bacterium]|nr:tRNA (adenosine(37)-N6)-dimethylallyltransferase MiaA [Deltaproteobacteria bacterium]
MNHTTPKAKIIVICGPTGIGKTSVAIRLAEHFNGQIIGADSMQIYKYMDIGTAKPTIAEQARVVHHMVGIVTPDEPFDAALYAESARQIITGLCQHDILPFVVGGTGLYIKALLFGLFNDDVFDPHIRLKLKAEAQTLGIDALHQRLHLLDPETAQRLHPNDTYRILRALEVVETSGKPISRLHREHGFAEQSFDALKIGLQMERELLYERINQRVDAMFAAGFLDEVKNLLARGYAADLKAMQSIGYRQMVETIQGRIPIDDCLRIVKRDHRRYAKRQLTWFNADPVIVWKSPEQIEEMIRLIDKFIGADKVGEN